MKHLSVANRWNAALIDDHYATWLRSPSELDASWRAFFEGFELASEISPKSAKQGSVGVWELVQRYRTLGHMQAKINPLQQAVERVSSLKLESVGLGTQDLTQVCTIAGTQETLQALITRLESIYCGTTGYQYMHIQDLEERMWLQNAIEQTPKQLEPRLADLALRSLVQAETLEEYLHTKFVGQKRFSLEGGESLMASLEYIADTSSHYGIRELVMGMAHRGRLNVLVNFLGKPAAALFKEFSEKYIPATLHGDGDVKYHMGHDSVRTSGLKLHLSPNPSHLEAVNPVIQGKVRARQTHLHDDRKSVLPLLIHGDASFAGQGIVQEVFNYSQLRGYTTGGTLHWVINNQIGFTTLPKDGRSSRYSSDVGKMIEAPIFLVNGDDALAVMRATDLALRYRQQFGKDVIIEMLCYRKYGHNESDEPMYTQPTLYAQIVKHPKVSTLLAKEIGQEAAAKEIKKNYTEQLDVALDEAKKAEAKMPKVTAVPVKFQGTGPKYPASYTFDVADTHVKTTALAQVTEQLLKVPGGFHLNTKLQRQLEAKHAAYQSGKGIDWGLAEAWAFGSLLLEGKHVRLSGQDCERGTFSHRHAVYYDTQTGQSHTPLQHLKANQGRFEVYNSSLSEAAVLGFEHGYSLTDPATLVLWEAQFGDFANGAQIMLDQFITSGESKWMDVSSVICLLPHGYMGQGPEHSSGRLERFLQSCADDNIEVCNVTTPAQYFHLLRRSMLRPFRKPLVLMTPKNLLRHKDCVSDVAEFTKGHFHTLLDDVQAKATAERVIFCTGKLYYELLEAQHTQGTHAAIVRIEQLYPLDTQAIQSIFKRYKACKNWVWCQEEPQNMGAWSYIAPRLTELLGQPPRYVGRPAAASPSTGKLALHNLEQSALIHAALH